jgi:hypothetical protein
LYEALAGASDNLADDTLYIALQGDPFVSHERHGQVVVGWIEGMRGANVSLFSYDEPAKEYMDYLRKSAEEEGIIA